MQHRKIDVELARTITLEGLRELGRKRGHSFGWADAIYNNRIRKAKLKHKG